ncbi:ABC transporter permease [Intestinibacter bartlettii]|uniref:ABC transporter permease n=1 Tax=Intestinibacter bartlettii TaxID=261299 RepID=UPI0034B92CD5
MRIKALTIRILKQLLNDKRTIGLIIVAPILILSLVYYILCGNTTEYKIGIINAPQSFLDEIKDENDDNVIIKTEKIDKKDIDKQIKEENKIAVVDMDDDFKDVKIYIDGTDNAKSTKAIALIKSAIMSAGVESSKENLETIKDNISNLKDSIKDISKLNPNISSKLNLDDIDTENMEFSETNFDTEYIYGSEDQSMFDNYAAALVGIIVFLFVYLLSGINFLSERTSGTLERLLSTPIKRGEIIIGYVLGFSTLAVVQTILITLFVVYGLGVTQVGNIGYVLLINLLTSISALILGMLLSTLANNEFQFVQFIPIVILPQVFLCGLFELGGVLNTIGHFVPLYYTTEALKEVMIRGYGFSYIAKDCLILIVFSALFMLLNIRLLKKQRSV